MQFLTIKSPLCVSQCYHKRALQCRERHNLDPCLVSVWLFESNSHSSFMILCSFMIKFAVSEAADMHVVLLSDAQQNAYWLQYNLQQSNILFLFEMSCYYFSQHGGIQSIKNTNIQCINGTYAKIPCVLITNNGSCSSALDKINDICSYR